MVALRRSSTARWAKLGWIMVCRPNYTRKVWIRD